MGAHYDDEFLNHVLDLLQSFGPVKSRKMFGGYGIFLDGTMFALIADDALYFKVDDLTLPNFEELGLPSFVYNKQGKDVVMSYSLAPDDAMEDGEVMSHWAELAYDAAMRNASPKKRKSS